MKKEEFVKFNIIFNLSPSLIVNAVGISGDMAQKYKSGNSLPPLDKALILKKEYKIPMELWVELWNIAKDFKREIKEYREYLKNV